MTRYLSKGFVAALALSCGAMSVAQDTSAERVWLQEHNKARDEFGSAALRWNPDLAREARDWARHLARKNYLRHSSRDQRRGTGENLWMGTRGFFSPSKMIAGFVDERRDFVPGRFPEVSRTGRWSDVGHFTQIVWPETREVGCALATGDRYDVLVCRYWPSGNVMGQTITPRAKVAKR